MRLPTESVEKFISKANRVRLRSYKRVYHQMVTTRSDDVPPMLFIFGGQRSGTTLLVNIFEKDLRTKMYREFSELSSMDKENGVRYDPLPVLTATIKRTSAPFLVLKPLVESQNAPELLDYFPSARAIWVYRDYRDVAASNLNKFGVANGVDDVKPIAYRDQDNWRSERASDKVHSVIKQYYSPEMAPHDAAALFWYARNQLYFDLGLDHDPRVMIIKYEELVHNPHDKIQQIYTFMAQPFPGPHIVSNVHVGSVGKGCKIQLTDEIDSRCDALLNKLNNLYYDRNPVRSVALAATI